MAGIGNSKYKDYEGQLELISIYVIPEYWNLGVGSLLLKEVFQYAMNNNYIEIGLWVLDGNYGAMNFYEKKGFSFNGDIMTSKIGGKLVSERRYIKKFI